MKWGKLFVAALLLAVGGCETGAQKEAKRINTAIDKGDAEIDACWAKAAASPDYQPFKDKLPLPGSQKVSMAMQANPAKPTPAEAAKLITLYQHEIEPCRKTALEAYGRTHPAYAVVMSNNNAKADAAYAQLIRRELSWGQYAEETAQRSLETNAQIIAAGEKIRANLRQANAYQMQQMQAATDAFQQWNQQQQLIGALNQTRITTCSYIGTFLSCTTN